MLEESAESADAFRFAFYDNESFAHIILGQSAANLIERIVVNRYVIFLCAGLNVTTAFAVLGPEFMRCADLWQWADCTEQTILRVVCYDLIVLVLFIIPWLSGFILLWNKKV